MAMAQGSVLENSGVVDVCGGIGRTARRERQALRSSSIKTQRATKKVPHLAKLD
jgi:hypothetical protein